jgi:hypothetical protein
MGITWAKTGASASQALEKYEKEQAIQAEQNRKMWRFWVKEGEEARITFLDGDLNSDGALNFFGYLEHNLLINGSWGNTYVCTRESEPCPICAAGDKPSFVGVFSIIDHSEYKSKKGEIYKDTPKLFVAKKDTLKLLHTIAVKRGGLAGCTFDAMRTGDKSASVGSMFDFVEKQSLQSLMEKYTRKEMVEGKPTGKMVTIAVPANYEHEITYFTAEELRENVPTLASVAAPTGYVSQKQVKSVQDQL